MAVNGEAGAAPAPTPQDRDEDDRVWLELVGKTGEAPAYSPVYRMRLAGQAPIGVFALPKDYRPVNRARGAEIMAGRWRFGAGKVETPPGHAPWGPRFPSLHFSDRIHRFHWMRDVAAQGPEGESRARSLTASWIDAFGKWDAFAWRIGPTADRLINILTAGPWLLSGFEGDAREALLDSLGRQSRHLLASAEAEPDPAARFRAAVALCLTGAAMDEGAKRLEAGLVILEKECAAQILADGGHVGRSPEALADALIDIQTVEDLLLRLGHNAPAYLTRLQPRMAAMLGFFTLPGGALIVANGGGDGTDEQGAGVLAQAALASHGGGASRFSFARLSAWQRVQAEELTLHLDTGAGPDRGQGGRSGAGALAIHVADGPDVILTSCGASCDLEPVLREASRRTAAYSVLSIEDDDSAIFAFDPGAGMRAPEGPAGISARRLEENEQFLLEGQHSGWRVRHGVIYRRRLYIAKNGARITGEDSLSRPMSETAPAALNSIPYALRFHLHPDVQVAPGPDERTVFLGLPLRQRVWRFRSEALLSVEISRYWGAGGNRRSHQLVVRGEADPKADGSQIPNRVRWALSRVEPSI